MDRTVVERTIVEKNLSHIFPNHPLYNGLQANGELIQQQTNKRINRVYLVFFHIKLFNKP